jgi:PAS domain S-box-containing protein
VHERTLELEESEEKYRILVENANEAVVVFQNNIIRFFNRKTLEISGYSQHELSSKPIVEFIYPDDRNLVIERYIKRIQGGNVPSSYEFRMIHRDGSVMWVNINAVLINWGGNPAVLGLMTDITERKNMEQELRAYARKITQVQEEERKRIAYELHDDTAQYLSILKLQLDSVIDSGKIQDSQLLEKLRFLEKDAGRAVDDVRRYSHELRPGVLEYLGLQAALEQIAEDINKLQQIKVEVRSEGEEQRLSEDLKLGFFRIAQEAISNARKHSNASKVTVSLKYAEEQIRMIISDHGAGFDVQKAKMQTSLKGSLGLTSMQERAKLIGANLEIESNPGKGTRVTVQVKLRSQLPSS